MEFSHEQEYRIRNGTSVPTSNLNGIKICNYAHIPIYTHILSPPLQLAGSLMGFTINKFPFFTTL